MMYMPMAFTLGWSWMQPFAGWRLDLPSLALGAVLGIAASLLFVQLVWPLLQRTASTLAGRGRHFLSRFRLTTEERFQVNIARAVQEARPAWGEADVTRTFVAPRLLAPQEEPDPIQPFELNPRQLHYLWPSLADRTGGTFAANGLGAGTAGAWTTGDRLWPTRYR